jgi:hypothetical protein
MTPSQLGSRRSTRIRAMLGGQANAHKLNDKSDALSLDNRAALEQKLEKEEGKNTDAPSNA